MTTAPEVKRWTKTILAEHDDLTLEGRDLYLRPVNHVLCAIRFLGSSNKAFPTPTASVGALCGSPSSPFGLGLGLDLLVGYSTDAGFQQKLEQDVREILAGSLRRVNSLEAFYELTCDYGGLWIGSDRLSSQPPVQAAVLAALGKLVQASSVIDAHIKWLDETKLRARLVEAEDLLARRPGSAIARIDVRSARYWLEQLRELKELADLIRENDRPGIGALLHTWEQQRARSLGIAHLWEPTPFPVEMS